MWTGEQAPPPGAAAQIFNLSRGSFALRAKPQNPADSAPPATPSKFRSRRYAAQAKFARKRFLLWEMGFPDAKISTRSRRTRRRERFICERAAALSRSPWGLDGGYGTKEYCERALNFSRPLLGFWQTESPGAFSAPGAFIFGGTPAGLPEARHPACRPGRPACRAFPGRLRGSRRRGSGRRRRGACIP